MFQLGQYTMDGLSAAVAESDFALFVLGQDDETASRGKVEPSPRDNVVFEAGLFTPVLGRGRVFYSVDCAGSKMPSDWEGLGYTKHDSSASGRDKIVPACHRIRDHIVRLGQRASRPKLWRNEEESALERGILGPWVDFITSHSDQSVVGRFEIRMESEGVRIVNGTSWNPDGAPQARFRSESLRVRHLRVFYSWSGEHPKTSEPTGYFGSGSIDFEPPPESSRDSIKARGRFSITPEARPEDTVIVRRVLRRPTADDDADLTSEDPKRVGRAVKRLLERWKEVF